MQRFNHDGQSTPMGRDPNFKWVHWLALSRRNGPGSMSTEASSPDPFPPACFQPSPYVGDSKSLRSSTTGYFALLSAGEKSSNDDATIFACRKHQGSVPSWSTRDMDSSWVAWFTGRCHQRQLPDIYHEPLQEEARNSYQSFPNVNNTPLPTDVSQDPGTIATMTAPAVSSSEGMTSPLRSPLSSLWDMDIDSLSTEFLPDLCSASPFDLTDIQAYGAERPCATAWPDGGDFAWLEEQQALPLNLDDEPGNSGSASKRTREEYSGDYANDDQSPLKSIMNKKQRIIHPQTSRLESSSPYSSNMSRPSQ